MIRNIVFDMGNVLFDFNPHLYIDHRVESEADRLLLRNNIFATVEWVAYDRGALTEELALEGILHRIPQRLQTMAREIFLHWHEDIRPREEMFSLARRMQQQGYRVYLLSNAAKNFYTFRHLLPGLDVFDGLFISSDWMLLKPETAIYSAFCSHFSLVPSQCFFIDDSPVNVEGAQRAGLAGVVFNGDLQQLEGQLAVALAVCNS